MMRLHHAMLLLFVFMPSIVVAAPLDDLDLPIRDDGQKVDKSQETESVLDLNLLEDITGKSAPRKTGPAVDAIQAFQSRDIDACMSHLRQAVAEDPSLPPPKLLLAGLHHKSGNLPAARRLLESVAAEDPTHPELYLTLANIAIEQGRYAEALLSFQRMEELGPTDGWSDEMKRRLPMSISLGRATVAERRGNWQQAQQQLAAVVRMAPQSSSLRDRWATALLRAGREESAFDQFDIAYQQDKSQNPPEVSMGVVNLLEGKVTSAESWYEKALSNYPDDPRVNLEWAKALSFLDRASEANEHVQKAAALGLKSDELSLQQGIVARQLGQLDDASEHLKKAIESEATREDAYYHLILTLSASSDKDDRSEALKLAQQAIAEFPRSAFAPAALGAALHANKRFIEAERALRLAASRRGASLECIYLLGRVLNAQSKNEEAEHIRQIVANNIEKPSLFVLRPAARQWIAEE